MTPLIISSPTQLPKILPPNSQIVFSLKSDEKKSVTIAQIRQLIGSLSLNRHSQRISIFTLENAHLMTQPAQNSLLKTLEESRQNQLIVLVSDKPHKLLPTILSRCQTIKDSPSTKTERTAKIRLQPPLSAWKTSVSHIPSLSDQIIKNDPQQYLNSALYLIHQAHRQKTNPQRIYILKVIHDCLSELEANLNPRLTLDHFFFKLNKKIN